MAFEEQLLNTVKKLSPAKRQEVLDFARLLAGETEGRRPRVSEWDDPLPHAELAAVGVWAGFPREDLG